MEYAYGNPARHTLNSVPWDADPSLEIVSKLRRDLETKFQTAFNSCFITIYGNRTSYTPIHVDNQGETPHHDNSFICNVSMGSERFLFLPRHQKKILCENGTVISWKASEAIHHGVPMGEAPGSRVCLSFRNLEIQSSKRDRKTFSFAQICV